jgi:hypothetical protein
LGDGFQIEGVPARCDGCGRDATAAGMLEDGFTVRLPPTELAGCYCSSCAAVLRLVSIPVECVNCGCEVDDDDRAEWDGWRYWLDENEKLRPVCPDCEEHEVRSLMEPHSD